MEITDPLGRKTFLQYDRKGRVIRRQHPDEGLVETIDYFAVLNLQVETDPMGGVTRTTFDDEGRVVLIENAEGGRKVFEYDAAGRKILESRWFDGETPRDDMVFEYDTAGRLITRRETLGRVTTFGALLQRFCYPQRGRCLMRLLPSEWTLGGTYGESHQHGCTARSSEGRPGALRR